MSGTENATIALIMALRKKGIRDQRVLSAIERTKRDLFVPAPFLERAFDDQALPIECGQTISQPYIVAYMTEKLNLDSPRFKVLEVGTGSGYQAAVLSLLCRRVYSIERYRSLMQGAVERFAALGVHNITTKLGDGARGWPEQAPFDRIIVTAAVSFLPEILIAQLKVGGIMVIPVVIPGPSGVHRLLRITREEEGIRQEELIPVRFVPLVEGVAPEG